MSIACINTQESTNQMKENEYNGKILTFLSIVVSHFKNKIVNHKRVKYTMDTNSSFIKLIDPRELNKELDTRHPLQRTTKLI